MTEITKKFTYNIPDNFLAQTHHLGKTHEWEYTGPDRIWVFVDDATGAVGEYNFRTLEEDGPTYPTPLDFSKIEVDCAANPLLGTLLRANKYNPDINSFPQITVNLPDGNVYSRPENPEPNFAYEASETKYVNGEWQFVWKKPWVSWQDIYKVRDQFLKQAELELQHVTTLPPHLQAKLEKYIEDLKNIETVWADLEPYMYVFPDYPL